MIRLLLPLSLFSLLLFGCGQGGDTVGPCASGFAVRFAITEVKDSLPLDSLFLRIALGTDGAAQDFKVNLKTGKSSAAIRASQGDAYALTFALFSAGKEIGKGESKGTLACDLNVALNPVWNDSTVKAVKEILTRGSILPPRLAESYGQAMAGKVFALPMAASDSVLYRWSLKDGDSVVLDGEGRQVSFTIPESLAGKTVVIRLMALDGEGRVLLEERRWNIAVLAVLSGSRLARVLVRTDSTAKDGSSQSLVYGDGKLVRIDGFDVLSPASGAAPVWAESLHYEGGRLVRARVSLPGGASLDSLFGYDGAGMLRAVEVRTARDTVIDSLFHEGGRLASSRRYVSGVLRESALYRWNGTETRTDSVFTPAQGGFELTRIIRNRFAADSLVERIVSVGRGTLVPSWRETLAYNGLGRRAWREVWTEGASSTLERTEKYRYDGSGRLLSVSARDEVAGENVLDLRYLYEGAAPSPASKISAIASAQAAFQATFGAAAFAHDGWRLPISNSSHRVQP